jgi:hypothetical protein
MIDPIVKEPAAPTATMAGNLRQMIAVLEAERQALAGLDPEALDSATLAKEQLCLALAPSGSDALDDECRALALTAQHLNEVNRRVRNLLAANVAARLEMLGKGCGASFNEQIASA